MLGLTTGFVGFGAQNILGQDTDGDGVPDFHDNCPATPNPEKIAFTSYSNVDYEIYVMNADGSNKKRLTNNPDWDFDPAFSYNGSKIAFVSECNKNNLCNIYVMNADGSNRTRLTGNLKRDRYPSFSPDGSKIVFNRLSSDGRHLDIQIRGD